MDRREQILAAVAAADPALPAARASAAVDAMLTHPAVTRELAAAMAADPAALTVGAPPVIGRLVAQLRRHGSILPQPACARCGRTDRPLTRSDAGGVCPRCRRRQLATACTRCGVVKPVAGRDGEGQPVCARCADRPQRECGRCGRVRRIAIRARDGAPDICDGCFQGTQALCVGCGRRRPCAFVTKGRPTCQACRPRALAACAHCGQHRPPAARWPQGPVCDPCYTAALRHRGPCTNCGQRRRLVDPPGPDATTCADCTSLPTSHLAGHTCVDCGIEDKLYERARCAPCALRRRTTELLRAGAEHIPTELTAVFEAIVTTSTPRSALNWLRKGAGAKVLTELAAGSLPATHQALDAHPHRRAADYLRDILMANHVLPPRDEALVRTEHFLAHTLAGIDDDPDRRLVATFATWRVLRRLRRHAQAHPRPRTYTRHAHQQITAAARLLAWLAQRHTNLRDATQADLDAWLAGGPETYQVRDFLGWASEHRHCRPLHVPTLGRNPGVATSDDDRWTQLARLLHDANLELTDRVGGALLLLYGQQLSRITTITTDQITHRADQVFLRFGHHDVHIPEPLATLLTTLARDRRRYLSIGSPITSTWLFPGLLPGRPLTAARLGQRLRTLGIHAQPGRRAALTSLAAQLPAAVLAELLNLHPTTAVRWVRDAGGDWNRYAAQLAQTRNHQP
ncbi:MAG: hypothetical protein ACRDSO_08315 [Pseudonocardiaceae bacterium]